MNFLSTFTGIGGFDLGLERANWRCAGQVEIEPYCVAVLQKHWPDVWRHRDVKTLTGELIRTNCGLLDALVGGPPCQPSSVAGERRGADDDRWMWPDYLRLVSEINDAQERPLLWLLAENPRGVLSINVEGLQFTDWLAREFEARGYELLPVELAAEDVGAPHRRERIWFVGRLADPAYERRSRKAENARQLQPARNGHVAYSESDGWLERRAEPAWIKGRPDAAIGGQDVVDTGRRRRRTPAERRGNEPDGADAGRKEETGRPALRGEELADADRPRQHEPPRSNGKERRWIEDSGGQWPSRPGEPQHEWEEPRVVAAEPQMGSATNGISKRLAGRRRVAALKALGNAVVPQCAEVLGRMINRYEEER